MLSKSVASSYPFGDTDGLALDVDCGRKSNLYRTTKHSVAPGGAFDHSSSRDVRPTGVY
ncbi:MAG: hypothetical protein ACK53Y_11200 [bacterium]